MTLSRCSVALSLALALHPVPAMAQAKCEVDEKKPNQVKDASNALAKASLPCVPEAPVTVNPLPALATA